MPFHGARAWRRKPRLSWTLFAFVVAVVVTQWCLAWGHPQHRRRPDEPCPQPSNTCADPLTYRIAYYEAGADSLNCHPVHPTALDPTLYTHLHIAGANVSRLLEVNGSRVLESPLPALVDLKQRNPDLKVILSVGSFTNPQLTDDGCHYFSKVSASEESRAAFVTSAKEVLAFNHLDGIDLIVGYPESQSCLRPDDERAHFLALVTLLRETLDLKNLTISMSILPPDQPFHEVLDLPRLAPLLNYTVLRARDSYYGLYNNMLNLTHPADLLDSVDHLLEQDMPSDKIILEVLASGPLLVAEEKRSYYCVDPARCKAMLTLSPCDHPECVLARDAVKDLCVNHIVHPTFRELLLLQDYLSDRSKKDYGLGFASLRNVGWVIANYNFTVRVTASLARSKWLGGYSLRAVHGDSSTFDLSKALSEAYAEAKQLLSNCVG